MHFGNNNQKFKYSIGVGEQRTELEAAYLPSFYRSSVRYAPYTTSLQDICGTDNENIDITNSQLISRSKFKASGQLTSKLLSQSNIFSQSQKGFQNSVSSLDNSQTPKTNLTDLDYNFWSTQTSKKNDKSKLPQTQLSIPTQHRSYTPKIITHTPKPLAFERKSDFNDSGSQMVLRPVAELRILL
ncbi:uncharacterized protein [Antedon mediterranea]|uniref:uncharacterized protein n=1 Tax=Antedon mediterranea TaxID=105859 RepID=UPI003AF6DEC6